MTDPYRHRVIRIGRLVIHIGVWDRGGWNLNVYWIGSTQDS